MLDPLRVARFVAAGGGSLAVDLALQWVFLALVGLPVWLGSALSYELALVGHFAVTNRWVFGRAEHSWRRLWQFQVTALAASAITLGVTWALVYGPTAPYFGEGAGPFLAKIAGTGVAFGWTFTSSFMWIWRSGETARV